MRKPRFEPEAELWTRPASEEPLPSSPDLPIPSPKFVPGDVHLESNPAPRAFEANQEAETSSPAPAAPDISSSWRDEIANRVHSYRSKRGPQKPRFPSLSLKFEGPEASYSSAPNRDSVAPATSEELPAAEPPTPHYPRLNEANRHETGRLIEFPRLPSLASSGSELADPVIDIPRILEAPEAAPPPPALGGMTIESPQTPAAEKRPGIEVPLQLASMSRRITASVVDALLVLAAFAFFGAVFYKVTGLLPDLRETLPFAVPVLAFLWFGYQYLNLVHTRTTPGLRLARLQLNAFDGTIVPRRKRRWRVFASVLSLASLGLGYAWALMDEDQLCWHDRVTATHIAPKPNQ